MLTQKSQNNFICTKCDYTTCKYSDYNKHLLTRKHRNVDKMLTKTLKMSLKKNMHVNVEKNINIDKAYLFI